MIGRIPSFEPAILHGYHRYRIRGEQYPAIYQTENGTTSVRGIFCHGLSECEMEKLDAWEDDEYVRIQVIVDVEMVSLDEGKEEGSRKELAFVFQWGSSDLSRLYGTWTYDEDFAHVEDQFLRTHCP